MLIKLNEYKGKLRDAGKRVSNEDIAEGTGINLRTIENISSGTLKEFRGEYVDALTVYFAKALGVPVAEINLIQAEPITLPLSLNIRPDRHGAKVGERTKAPSASSGAERTAPAPSAPVAEPVEGPSRPAVAEPAEAPITAASLRKPLALQLPGIGQEGEPDRAKFAALEERRRMLLQQAGQIKGG